MAQHDKADQAMIGAAETVSEILGNTVIEKVEHLGLTRAEFAEISDFSDAIAALGGLDAIGVATPELIGDGSVRLDKENLCGVPFIITGYDERLSADFPDENGELGEYIVIRGVTRSGTKFWCLDGSRDAGLRIDLKRYTERTGQRALYCPRGLTMSVYDIKTGPDAGKKGRSFFIDTRPAV